MQYRRPSSLVPSDCLSIRRRSGDRNRTPNPSSSNTCRTTSQEYCRPHFFGQTAQIEEDVAFQEQPTVALVHSSRVNLSLPTWESITLAYTKTETVPEHRLDKHADSKLSASVPLVLCPPASSRLSSSSSVDESGSPVRLPTPDFTASKDVAKIVPSRIHPLNFIGRVFSFTTPRTSGLPSPSSETSFVSSQCPQSSRSNSVASDKDGSMYSAQSRGTTTWAKYKCGQRVLVPSLSSANKFTHKWPKPQSLRTVERRRREHNCGRDQGWVAAALEEGHGLGMNRVERWNIAKWCLVLSLSTVFIYGMVGLVCAILTWFRSEHCSSRCSSDWPLMFVDCCSLGSS
jgi:hypothetical protein